MAQDGIPGVRMTYQGSGGHQRIQGGARGGSANPGGKKSGGEYLGKAFITG